jgi:hypothetical protein
MIFQPLLQRISLPGVDRPVSARVALTLQMRHPGFSSLPGLFRPELALVDLAEASVSSVAGVRQICYGPA